MYTIFFSQSSSPLVGYTFQCKVLCISSLVCLSGGEVGDNLLLLSFINSYHCCLYWDGNSP